MEDQKIVDLFWQKNENAISEVGIKYTNYCYTIAWNVLSNNEDSEECVNDTWFAAWKRMPPKRPAVLSSFLGKITRCFAIDRLRMKCASKRMDNHIVELTEEVENLSTQLTYTLDEQMEEKELIHSINRFLNNLKPQDRDIFVRRYWYMDSVKAIAKRHSSTESKIKSNLHRNRKKMAKFLEGVETNAG